MAEPTLAMNWGEILNLVYQQSLGGGATGYTDETDDDKKALIDSMCESGLRQVYQPPPVGGKVHDWSFLYKQDSIVVEEDYSTGTIAYDHTGGTNERQVTLSGGGAPPAGARPPGTAAPRPARTGGDDAKVRTVRRDEPKIGRNEPCHCGSGKKYKKCHGA